MKLIRLELTLIIVETNALFRVRVPYHPYESTPSSTKGRRRRVEERLLKVGEEFLRKPTDHRCRRRPSRILSRRFRRKPRVTKTCIYIYIYTSSIWTNLWFEKGDTCDTRECYGNFRLGSWHKGISSSLLPVSLRRQRWRIPFRQFSQYRIEYVNFTEEEIFFVRRRRRGRTKREGVAMFEEDEKIGGGEEERT